MFLKILFFPFSLHFCLSKIKQNAWNLFKNGSEPHPGWIQINKTIQQNRHHPPKIEWIGKNGTQPLNFSCFPRASDVLWRWCGCTTIQIWLTYHDLMMMMVSHILGLGNRNVIVILNKITFFSLQNTFLFFFLNLQQTFTFKYNKFQIFYKFKFWLRT